MSADKTNSPTLIALIENSNGTLDALFESLRTLQRQCKDICGDIPEDPQLEAKPGPDPNRKSVHQELANILNRQQAALSQVRELGERFGEMVG